MAGAELSARVWPLWSRGLNQSEIARELGVSVTTVRSVVAPAGGMPPAPRRRRVGDVTLAEREEISRGVAAGRSFRQIARELGRNVSVVSREVNNNGGRDLYRATEADLAAWKRARRPKKPKLVTNPDLAAEVTGRLQQRWSPKQIAATLRKRYPDNPGMQVSHETIYQALFVQAKGTLKQELTQYLRRKRRLRKPRAATTRAQHNPGGRGQITDRVPLSQRPAEATDRAVPGHWEGDLILGSHGSAVATLAERHSRFTMILALPGGKTAESVRDSLATHIPRLPALLNDAVTTAQAWKTLTWDQGKEMSQHTRFTIDTGIPVYFCPPGQPWLRGTNENTNGLIRDYLPKGTDLRTHTQPDLDHIATQLNTRPRQTLNWMTPSEKLAQALGVAPTP